MRQYGVIIAARMGSRRLPGKALLPLKDVPLIVFLVRRLKTSRWRARLVLATTTLEEDDKLVKVAGKEGIDVFRGDRDDVVARFVNAASAYDLEYVVRVTGDCPFMDGPSLDYCLNQCEQLKEFALASTKGYFPVGIDYEIYNAKTMELLHHEDLTKVEREHLTLAIHNRPDRFQIIPLLPPDIWPHLSTSFTVDTESDYQFAKALAESQDNIYFDIHDLLRQAVIASNCNPHPALPLQGEGLGGGEKKDGINMRIDYSKSSADIQKEANIRLKEDEEQFRRQSSESKRLLDCEDRKKCVLCGKPVSGEVFSHRGIPVVICNICGHVQTRALPPDDYPNVEFSAVYPKLSPEEYEDRKARIYKPKLDWIISCLRELDHSITHITQMKWVEMGSGAGCFISALLDAGMKDVKGFDADKVLVDIANTFTTGSNVSYYNGKLSDALDLFPADIYVAFFVLEHIEDVPQFFLKLKCVPQGTIFIFSVPVFGFSCIFENIFEKNYARNLDCVLHTQLYTDTSIRYSMAKAGFEIVAEWIFGQDAMDFTRFILNNLSGKFSEQLLENIRTDYIRLQDVLQNLLDKLSFSDQRHIIAIRR